MAAGVGGWPTGLTGGAQRNGDGAQRCARLETTAQRGAIGARDTGRRRDDDWRAGMGGGRREAASSGRDVREGRWELGFDESKGCNCFHESKTLEDMEARIGIAAHRAPHVGPNMAHRVWHICLSISLGTRRLLHCPQSAEQRRLPSLAHHGTLTTAILLHGQRGM